MLELGKAGSTGTSGEAPVLRDGAVVATLRASDWRESATALVESRHWQFAKDGRDLVARLATDPESAVRLRARQTSFWKGTWTLDLDGRRLDVRTASYWKGTHRYTAGDRVVGESGTTGGWSPRPTVTVADGLTLDHQVFLLWFELVVSRRNSQAAMGAVIAGGVVAGGSS
jgi:hypothetical protein